MPGKSKHKKARYVSSKKANVLQTSSATAAQSSTAGATTVSRPSSSSGKQAVAHYTPDQFKYVGTELKVAGILSAIILIIIVVLYFVLR